MKILFGLVLLCTTASDAYLGVFEDRERLMKDLLKKYDKYRIPIDPKNGNPVNTTVYMWPYDILYVNEAQGSMKISGWIDMRWSDPFLRWDPAKYNGINETFIVRRKIWLPEIDIFYRKESNRCNQPAGIAHTGAPTMARTYYAPRTCEDTGANQDFSKDTSPVTQKCLDCPSRVTHEGNVLRGYYFSYSFPCIINVKYFPFDEHRCTLELANWHLDDRNMDLYPEQPTVDLSIFLRNEEWDLPEVNVTRKRDNYNYGFFPILVYTIKIKRKPFYYICNLVIPTIVLTITALIGYHMPSGGNGVHQEKVKMGLTTILSIFILQLGVSDKLPRTSDVVPLIAIFYSCMVGLLSMAIVTTSLVILVEKQGIYDKPIPLVLKRMIFRESALSHPTSWSVHKCHNRCRMLDCGCRLKKSNYELLSNAISPMPCRKPTTVSTQLMNNSPNSGNFTMPKQKEVIYTVLVDTLNELKTAHAEQRYQWEIHKEKTRIRADWSLLADKIENLCMFVYMLSAAIVIFMFFYHDWWY